MKRIKLFEDFKNNNLEGSLITLDDVIKCASEGGVIYATIVKDLPDNDPEEPLRVVDVDEDGLVTIEFDGSEYSVELKNIEKIEF
jgi:hypothetical protein